MKLKQFLFLISAALISTSGVARELTDLNLEVTTAKRGSEAKQEAFDKAMDEATHRLTEQILGPERTAKIWAGMRPRLLKNSTRYVVFIKGSPPVETTAGSKMQIQMRLSPDNLETMLREFGAIGQQSVKLLPLILVSETKGSRYVWWADMSEDKTSTLAKDAFKKIYDQFAAKFKSKNIYVLDPNNASFRMGVPATYRSESLRREDQVLLGQYLKADVVISGRVDIIRGEGGASKVNYDLQMWQVKSGRILSEAQRLEAVSSDAPKVILQSLEGSGGKTAQELSAKLNEAMMAGSLNLNILRLVVEGSLGYRQQTDFKKLLGGVREIKIVRERLFEPSRFTLEVETPASIEDLAKSLSRQDFPQFKVDVGNVQDDSLVLAVRSLSSSSAQ